MKNIAILVMTLMMFGCSSKPPKQTQPYGELRPVFEKQSELNERVSP